MPDSGPISSTAVTIPDHELIRPIGRGSYGEVWLARSVLGEYRAVKIIRRDAFDRGRPVERELEGIQKYEPISRSHEHQVHILHVGRMAEGFYYVMELADDVESQKLEGRSQKLEGKAEVGSETEDGRKQKEVDLLSGTSAFCLLPSAGYQPRTLRSEVQRRGRMPVAECLEIALKLTGALAHLHSHGLVHRDVKPSNIIFVRGQPKLADIGLVASSDSTLSCVGTEGFLPPEGPGKPQADLYALGKVLYEISTGRDRQDFPELPTMLREDPQRRGIEEFNEVILKACDPDVRRRYQTASEMRADLDLLRTGRSLQRVRRRQRRWAGAGKLAAVAVLAAILISLVSGWPPRPQDGSRSLPVRLAPDGAQFWRIPFLARRFDFSSDGERVVFAEAIQLAIWERKTGATRRLRLDGATHWWPAGPGGAIAMPRWAPDSRHFVFQAHRKVGGTADDPMLVYGLFLVNADTGEARQIGADLPAAERAEDICWRPDGEGITCAFASRRLATLALQGERTVWNDSDLPGEGTLQLGSYSRDGAWLLVSAGSWNGGSERRDVWAVPHLGGSSKRLTRGAGLEAYPTWGPGDETIYYVSDGGPSGGDTWSLWKVRWDRRTQSPAGRPSEVLVRKGSRFLHPRFVANGRRLAYAVEEPKTNLKISPSDALEKATVIARGEDPTLSPDGQTLYFVGETPEQTGVYAIHRTGDRASLRQLTGLKPLYTGLTRGGLSVSADGQWLAMYGRKGGQQGVLVIPTAGGEPRLLEKTKPGGETLPVWAPAGDWLAYTIGQQLVRVSHDGRVRETLATLPRWHGFSIRWSPDGTNIAAFGSTIADPKSEDSHAYVVNVTSPSARRLTPDDENQWKEGLEWHPSSQYLTYHLNGPGRLGAQIRRAYLDGRTGDLMIQQSDHWDYLGVWAPDGRRYFFVSAKIGEQDLHLYDGETKQIAHGVWNGGIASLPRWSSDGRTAVWAVAEPSRYFEVIEDFR